MRKIAIIAGALLLLAAIAGCGNASIAPADEESTTASLEESTSSYAELNSEIDRLEQLLAENGISSDEERYPIDISMHEELLKPENMSPVRSAVVVSEHGKLWEAEMIKYYDLLLKELREDHKELLVSSQKKWEAFVDDKNTLEYQIMGYSSGWGSMMMQMNAGIFYDQYKERALHLMLLHRNISDYQAGIEFEKYLESSENN